MVSDLQARVDQLELGSNCNHEAIISIHCKLDSTVNQIPEEVGAQIREQLQGFVVMFVRQQPISLSPNFPPRERVDPILLS